MISKVISVLMTSACRGLSEMSSGSPTIFGTVNAGRRKQIMGNSVYVCKVIKNMPTEMLFMQQESGL
jgi:hypothetical protein